MDDIKYNEHDEEVKHEDNQCIICFELKSPSIILVCTHIICYTCADRWFLANNKEICPTCKEHVSGEFVDNYVRPIAKTDHHATKRMSNYKFEDVIVNHNEYKVNEHVDQYLKLLREIELQAISIEALSRETLYNLGEMYRLGLRTGIDDDKAINYHETAYRKDYIPSLEKLVLIYDKIGNHELLAKYKKALFYSARISVVYDDIDSISEKRMQYIVNHWIQLLKKASSEDALMIAEVLIKKSKNLVKRGIEILIDEAYKSYVPAMTMLAKYYNDGLIVPLNNKEAIKWYQRAAFRNNLDARAQLGMIYYFGCKDISKDIRTGVHHFILVLNHHKKVIKENQCNNYGLILTRMAKFFERDNTPDKDVVAYSLYIEAHNIYKYGEASYELGNYYHYGKSLVNIDPNMAIKYYLDAIDNKYPDTKSVIELLFSYLMKGNYDAKLYKDKIKKCISFAV